jgi:hypothetical protein
MSVKCMPAHHLNLSTHSGMSFPHDAYGTSTESDRGRRDSGKTHFAKQIRITGPATDSSLFGLVCHLAPVPFGACAIWRVCHLAHVPFGTT